MSTVQPFNLASNQPEMSTKLGEWSISNPAVLDSTIQVGHRLLGGGACLLGSLISASRIERPLEGLGSVGIKNIM